MNFQEACRIALTTMPGYILISASEIETGWIFSFSFEDGSTIDEPSLFVSKKDGSVKPYSMGENLMETLFATPISLSDVNISL